jgi:putative two-component system response regulator
MISAAPPLNPATNLGHHPISLTRTPLEKSRAPEQPVPDPGPRILIVDDQPEIRRICRYALRQDHLNITEVGNGYDALQLLLTQPFDLVILDMDLPGLSGERILHEIRSQPMVSNMKIIMCSGRANGDDLSMYLNSGADDYLTKPFSLVQMRSRINAALRLKEAQDRANHLTDRIRSVNDQLEKSNSAKSSELVHARAAIVLAMAKLVEQRSSETGPHLFRLRNYCRTLARAAMTRPAFEQQIDETFVSLLVDSAPLHDIGKVGIPDHILNKPCSLTHAERWQMQAHTVIGADTLDEVAREHPFAQAFFHTASEIARHHHERWDGKGYPNHLQGAAIPLSARILAIADVYDALRSKRVYKKSFTHDEAVKEMLFNSPGHFDPQLIEIFSTISDAFGVAYRESGE